MKVLLGQKNQDGKDMSHVQRSNDAVPVHVRIVFMYQQTGQMFCRRDIVKPDFGGMGKP
jgi:hypothetical protein